MSQTATLPVNFRQILGQTVAPEFRKEIVETFLADREARPAVQEALQALATLRKLRPQTIAQFGKPERVQMFLGTLSQPGLETAAMQALQVWFLRKGRPLMGALLNAWGVPHQDGELDDDTVVPPLAVEQVRTAVAAVAGNFPAGQIDAYLAYSHLAPPEETWSAACGAVLQERLAA